MQLHIQNMTCEGCARSVTKAIRSVDPEATVTADLARRTVDVHTAAPRKALAQVLAEVGYAPN